MNERLARLPRRSASTALALLFLLAGCASVQPPSASDAPRSIAASRSWLEEVSLNGRLSVRYQANGKEEALHGGFSWTQVPGRASITLLSPLGQTIALIDVGRDGAMLTQAGQPARSAADVDALVAQTLGWPLPIAGLRHWLQGFAVDDEGEPFVATPQANQVSTRDGWRIRYPAWQEPGPGHAAARTLPRRIDLERTTAQAGLVSIRIVIDAWQ